MEGSVPEGERDGERIVVTYRDVSVVLVPSMRGVRHPETFDVAKQGDEGCIYTYLYLGSKGGFSGNRYARAKGIAEIGWMSHGNRLHPAKTPEDAAMKWLRWGRKAGSRTARERGVA